MFQQFVMMCVFVVIVYNPCFLGYFLRTYSRRCLANYRLRNCVLTGVYLPRSGLQSPTHHHSCSKRVPHSATFDRRRGSSSKIVERSLTMGWCHLHAADVPHSPACTGWSPRIRKTNGKTLWDGLRSSSCVVFSCCWGHVEKRHFLPMQVVCIHIRPVCLKHSELHLHAHRLHLLFVKCCSFALIKSQDCNHVNQERKKRRWLQRGQSKRTSRLIWTQCNLPRLWWSAFGLE